MGSAADDDRRPKSKHENPILSDNTLTQAFDAGDSPFLGEKFNEGGVQFDTLPLDSEFLYDTKVVSEVKEVALHTQVLDEIDCTVDEKEVILDSDGNDTEVTEVLLSDGDDQVSNDGTTLCKLKDSNPEIGKEDGTVNSEKRKTIYSYDQEPKDFLVDSDALTEDEYSSGCVQRSFTSIRAASLRSSGIAAAISMTPKKAEPNPAKSNSEVGRGQKENNVKSLHRSTDGIRKDNEITSFSDPTSFGTEVCELDHDHKAEKLHRNTREDVEDETKRMTRKTMTRKLFNESTSSGDEEKTRKTNGPTLKADSRRLLVSDHAIAGLSYVGSQEPGEQSQANAWNIIDKFLSINDVELDEKADPGKTGRGKSSVMSSAKGARSMAERADFKTPVGKAGNFDWIDSHEDEGGGDFFSKRKDALLEGRGNMRKSHTHPRKPKHLTFRQTGDAIDGFREKEENANPRVHQKIMNLTQSDSGLMLNSSIRTESRISKTITKKNLFKEMREELNTDLSGQKLETGASGGDPQGICDVGVDTQLAAEAMEALVCGAPANHDVADAYPLKKNATEGSTGAATKKNARWKKVCVRKTACSSTDSEHNTRQCKRTKKLSAKSGRGNPSSSRKQLKNSQAKWKHEENFNIGKSFNGNVSSNGKSSGTVKKRKMGKELDGTHIQEADEHHLSSMSNRDITSVAQHTRRSVTMISLKMPEILSNHSHPMEVSVLGSKKRGSDSVDVPEPVTVQGKNLKSCPDQIGKFSKNKMSRQEIQGTEGLNEEIPKTNYLAKDAFSYPKGRRTHRRMQHDLENCNEPHMPPEGDHIMLSSGKLRTISDFSVMSEKIPSKDQITPNSGTLTRSGRKYGADYSLSPVEDAEGNGTVGQSKGMVQTSGTACATPSKELNAVSPVYAGDDHTKQLGKKSLSRLPCMRELIRLGTPEVAQTPAWKDMRKRRDMASVCVLFSHHLGEDIIKQQKKILARLGVPIASSSSDATHFVADKFARTRNMLEAIALGKPVVTHLWLESCGQASCFIDEKNYIMRDSRKEKEIGFSMPVSLARACSNPLLQGKRVFITPKVKPDRELIANLVKAAHGQTMERTGRSLMKDNKVPSDLLIISCEEDYAVCAPLLEKGAEVYSSELLLNGIVIQKLEYDRSVVHTSRGMLECKDMVMRFQPSFYEKRKGEGFGKEEEG